MSTYETRPGGMAGAPVRSVSKAASRKQRILDEARAEGATVEERDGKVRIRKGAKKGAKR
jgi:hypothetical protein